jgi:hypothetical protein
MLTISSFKVALSRVKRKQKNANKFWLSVWHQAVAQAASEGRNLSLLNIVVNSVHSVPGMVIPPFVEAVLSIGGKDEKSEFPGMIAVEITKDGGAVPIKFRATKFKKDLKEQNKNASLVNQEAVDFCRDNAWWDIATVLIPSNRVKG